MCVSAVFKADDGEPRRSVGWHFAGMYRCRHDSDPGAVPYVRAVAETEEQAGLRFGV